MQSEVKSNGGTAHIESVLLHFLNYMRTKSVVLKIHLLL